MHRFIKNEGNRKNGSFYTIKPLIHLLRAEEIVDKIASGKKLNDLFTYSNPTQLLSIKYEKLSYQEA
jgi:hypothetical protein